uniref:Uncharacterized protein n=1 Tax=virus sp. ctLl75 TaxID=2828249 RepID=A0A8S5RAA1_9VIRU|nr:MAG TPA: hypothetical protein [virus sp. ctLl75]
MVEQLEKLMKNTENICMCNFVNQIFISFFNRSCN